MDTFLIEMSKKWMFTFKNFRNVYFHGKQHSAVVIKVTRWFWEPHSWQLMILIDSQSVNFTTFAILALFHNDGSGNFLFSSLYQLLSIHEKRFPPPSTLVHLQAWVHRQWRLLWACKLTLPNRIIKRTKANLPEFYKFAALAQIWGWRRRDLFNQSQMDLKLSFQRVKGKCKLRGLNFHSLLSDGGFGTL